MDDDTVTYGVSVDWGRDDDWEVGERFDVRCPHNEPGNGNYSLEEALKVAREVYASSKFLLATVLILTLDFDHKVLEITPYDAPDELRVLRLEKRIEKNV